MKKVCCFAGHSKIFRTAKVYEKLFKKIKQLIEKEDVSEFWVGNYGKFDALAEKAVKEAKKIYPHIKLSLMLPYPEETTLQSREIHYNEYDNVTKVLVPAIIPSRYRLIKCNEFMVNRSGFLICFIKHSRGGAVKTLEYAQKKKDVRIFSLAK